MVALKDVDGHAEGVAAETGVWRGEPPNRRPAFEIIPVSEPGEPALPLADDPLYRASAVGRSRDGQTAADHDTLLYGR